MKAIFIWSHCRWCGLSIEARHLDLHQEVCYFAPKER